LAKALSAAGIKVKHADFFDTLELCDVDANKLFAAARAKNITMLVRDNDCLQLSLDETTSEQNLADLAAIFGATLPISASSHIESFARTSEYLTHPVFNSHHSETAMLRYMKQLADYDYALDRGMIPLGSCTMKLNATSEMEPVTWPEFGNIHPFAPAEDVKGYLELVDTIQSWLSDLTGYDNVSIQPNAGSQGELAGLMAIRGYHLSRGDVQRDICLIPSSAHGTNAASAILAGMSVVVVECDENGNVDLNDLQQKIDAAGDKLSAIMITYPSTHGVFEESVVDLCERVHAAGGQVYIDGANTNAVIGYAKFGKFGGDVSHLNLHKTFAIPHGGGGPGIGPVAARAHLAPFLPGHTMSQAPLANYGPISAAPYGSAGVLPISWAYIRMMGADGLRDATAAAVLSANYVAKKLEGHYPLLYSGKNGLVAHECIIDIRPIQKETGISGDDVAKRLIDYGFHAPTMSFPVAGTLMIEPTESEPLAELDRFISAMIAIRNESREVAKGTWPAEDNPLHNAPHTAKMLVGDWPHPYSRELAVYPVAGQHRRKYWPIVRRIDSVYGDRNLFCSCPPAEAFA
jgi:glycine dehydrogenase